MSVDKALDKKLEEHRKFAVESRLRVNKLLAEHDPLYANRYHEKRAEIINQIQVKTGEVDFIKERLNEKQNELLSLKDKLAKLDDDYRKFEPM